MNILPPKKLILIMIILFIKNRLNKYYYIMHVAYAYVFSNSKSSPELIMIFVCL